MTTALDAHKRYNLALYDDRCAPRVKLRIPAMLRASASPAFQVVVVDLSVAGFACEAVTGMQKGALCWLTLPGMAGMQSEVVWNTGHSVGCAFAHLLNGAVLDSIIARHG